MSSFTPENAAQLLTDWPHKWWVAGGRALDLFLDEHTREHADLDIAILQASSRNFRQFLGGMTFWADHGDGRIGTRPLRVEEEPPVVPGVMWCRHGYKGSWLFDTVLNRHEGNRWIFKRSDNVQRDLEDIGLTSDTGIPYLQPEIVLLHKANNNRSKDLLDFANTLPHLNQDRINWLSDALQIVHPSHPWIDYLEP